MAFFSKLNPTPSFPAYSGPYKVGTCDCELPVHELDSPADAPPPDAPGTVSFRIFYPCTTDAGKTHRPVRWLPTPQRGYFSAYARFLGANPTFSDAFSLLPQLLHYTTIPALRNAELHSSSPESERWPVMIFSHGLGGSRNAYSYIVGTLASHGIVVVAPDHRDQSAPISYIRETEKTPAKTLGYQRYSHTPSKEVYEGRDAQLRIRLWELGLIHDAILKIDTGDAPKNLDPNSSTSWKRTIHNVLDQFKGKLDVHRPGSIIWAGHSFGACSMVQLTKSIFYQIEPEKAAQEGYTPLYVPSKTSSLAKQIRPTSSLILLDMWCLPLRSPATKWLWQKPMPAYVAGGPGGKALLAIESEAFVKWSGNLNDTKRALRAPKELAQEEGEKVAAPYIFYPATSAHLSQSDFGILFPWLLKRVLKVEEPERIVRLNARAILQVLRLNGHRVGVTTAAEMEAEEDSEMDTKILEADGGVRAWKWISTDVDADQLSVKEESKAPADDVDQERMVADVEL